MIAVAPLVRTERGSAPLVVAPEEAMMCWGERETAGWPGLRPGTMPLRQIACKRE